MDQNSGGLDPYDAAIAAELDLARRVAGLEVTELARNIDIPWRTLYRYLKGERAIPMSKFAAISRGLSVDAADIFEAAERTLDSAQQQSRVDSSDT